MRKKTMLLLAALFICQIAFPQVLISILLGDKLNSGKMEFGLDGGMNLASLAGTDDGKAAPFFNIGFYFDIKMKNPDWLFHTGVIVKSTMGINGLPVYSLQDENLDAAFEGGHVDRKINYFDVPIMMKYKLSKHFYVEAGPMVALRTTATDRFTTKVVDKDDLTFNLDIKDNFHRLDGGLMGGFGYRLLGGNGMNLGFRYYLGVVDITKEEATRYYNRSAYFVVGIPIGAGKAKKAEK